MTMDITQGINEDIVRYVGRELAVDGVVHLTIFEGKERRIVLASMPDEEQVMVAVEGSGCAFFSREHPPRNPFVFISDGFQLHAATMLTHLFAGLLHLSGAQVADDRATLALTHDRS